MRYSRSVFFIFILFALGSPSRLNAQGNEQQWVNSILEKSRESILDLEAARYHISYRKKDERDEQPVIMDNGTVFFEKIDGEDELGVKTKIQYDAVIQPDSVVDVFVYYDGNREIVYSTQEKVVRFYNGPAILTGNILGNLVETILISDNPFDYTVDEIEGYKIHEDEFVGDELCYVITLSYGDSKYLTDISSTWYISKNDYLPRKRVARRTYNGKDQVETFEITNFKINPDLPDSLFTLNTFPEGYEVEWPKDRAKEKENEPGLLKPGTQAPDWTLKNADGEEVSLSDYRGQIVILDFWGTWCLPCLEAMPELQRIHEKYDEITVLGVSTNEPANAEPTKFARSRDITYPIVHHGEEIIGDYNVSSFPTFYLIDKGGTIIHHAEGYGEGTGKKVEAVLDGYLDQ